MAPWSSVIPFETEEEAYAIANATEYGLAAGVWTRDLARAHRATRKLRAGTVWVNTYMQVRPGRFLRWRQTIGSGTHAGSVLHRGSDAGEECLDQYRVETFRNNSSSSSSRGVDAVTLEETIRKLQDRVDIEETFHAYCRHADNADIENMTALFVDDCAVSYVQGGEDTVYRGRATLHAFLSSFQGAVISGSHHISNLELIFDTPDVVRMHAYMYSWQRFKDFPVVADCHRWGRYENRMVRIGGQWRFSHMRLLSAGEYGGARIGEHFNRPFPPEFESK